MAIANYCFYYWISKYVINNIVLALITYFFNPSQIIQSIMVYAMFSFFAYQYFSYVVKTAN
jgi:hypothetical protein